MESKFYTKNPRPRARKLHRRGNRGNHPLTREDVMSATQNDLAMRHCKSCEGGVPPLSADEVEQLRPSVPEWQVVDGGKNLRREWKVRDFAEGLAFFDRIGRVAEAEDHHPDLHLTGYRNVAVELWTHAVGGLTENDFILAAKIDQLPVVKKV